MPSVLTRLVVLATLVANGALAATVKPPSQDPWYTAPSGFELKVPGTVLRIRAAPGNLTTISSNCSASYNVLYRTTDSQYKPTWAVTTVFVPTNPKPALLSYQFPYDSADVNASPSYAMYSGVGVDVNASLSKGWFVTVPGRSPLFISGAQLLTS